MQVHTLPTVQVPSALTDSFSWGHDPLHSRLSGQATDSCWMDFSECHCHCHPYLLLWDTLTGVSNAPGILVLQSSDFIVFDCVFNAFFGVWTSDTVNVRWETSNKLCAVAKDFDGCAVSTASECGSACIKKHFPPQRVRRFGRGADVECSQPNWASSKSPPPTVSTSVWAV